MKHFTDISNRPGCYNPDGAMRKKIREAVDETLNSEKIEFHCIMSVCVVGDDEIKELNNKYRNTDSVTDVLSFPMYGSMDEIRSAPPEDYEPRSRTSGLSIGDIILCESVIKEHAEEYSDSFENELLYMVVHSALHLLGYDHINGGTAAEEMKQKQDSIFEKIRIKYLI
ncbi:Endoribonuclease YbeY [bioreactor metagenome]|uniref:Endoribonuclease YbeY n=1 Tax=bioreactor metagenome TaxID=1076179 RepID=A0A644YRP6_9ZZZZ|nr:rRNA maturation RNase YbeY [Oscillospiraceae bacterium]